MSSRENNRRPCLIRLLVVGIFMPPGPALQAGGMLPVTATFQSQNGTPIQHSKSRYAKGAWIKVEGFAGSKYFYGQVQMIEQRKVAGYLYAPVTPPKRESLNPSELTFPRPKQDPPKQEQVYVYGEVVRPGEFRVFDQQGTLYRLLAVEDKR